MTPNERYKRLKPHLTAAERKRCEDIKGAPIGFPRELASLEKIYAAQLAAPPPEAEPAPTTPAAPASNGHDDLDARIGAAKIPDAVKNDLYAKLDAGEYDHVERVLARLTGQNGGTAEGAKNRESDDFRSLAVPVPPVNSHYKVASADSLVVVVTTTPSVRAAGQLTRKEGTWTQLVSSFEQPAEHESKKAMPLFKLASFKGSRSDENVEWVYGLVGDYDAGKVSVDAAADALELEGVEAVIYTTPRHTPEAPRWRVVAPLSKPHDPSEYAALMDRLNGALGGILAHESWTLSQVFYYGRVKGVPYETKRVHGTPIDLLTSITPVGKRGSEAPANAELPRESDAPITEHSPEHARLMSALAKIPNEREGAIDYHEWRNIGFALHHATDGAEWGREMYVAFSERSPRYTATHPTFTDARTQVWDHATKKENVDRACTKETLFAIARKHGWVDTTTFDGMEAESPLDVAAKSQTKRQFAPTFVSSAGLSTKEFKPIMFTVDNLLPEGVFLLAANPKVGKSWLALQLGLAVASGGTVLGERAHQGDVLYLALEDNERRLQSRLKKLNYELLPEDVLRRLVFTTEWVRVGAGGAEAIEKWLDEHPNARLVIVDVLERIRPARNAKANAYGEDYEALKALKAIADGRQITILVIHHTRKAASEDAMHLVSGTQGLTGGADGVLVLKRPIDNPQGELHIMARDLERGGAFAVQFVDAQWTMLGPASAVKMTGQRSKIVEALRNGGAMKRGEIAGVTGMSPSSVGHMLAKLQIAGVVTAPSYGMYELKNRDEPVDEGIAVAADDLV